MHGIFGSWLVDVIMLTSKFACLVSCSSDISYVMFFGIACCLEGAFITHKHTPCLS